VSSDLEPSSRGAPRVAWHPSVPPPVPPSPQPDRNGDVRLDAEEEQTEQMLRREVVELRAELQALR